MTRTRFLYTRKRALDVIYDHTYRQIDRVSGQDQACATAYKVKQYWCRQTNQDINSVVARMKHGGNEQICQVIES